MSSVTQSANESQNQTNMSQTVRRISAVNSFEAGRYLQNFANQGFKNEHCVGEYCGNSWDAKAKNQTFIVENTSGEEGLTNCETTLRIVDDGNGMDEEEFEKKYIPFHGENHTNDESTGTRGVGAKKANALLSNFTITKLIASKDGVNFKTLEQNWKKAIECNDLGELNVIRDSNADEVAQFRADRPHMSVKKGVTVVIPHKHDITKMFRGLISSPKDFVPERRLDIMMGRSNITFKFVNRSNPSQNVVLNPEDCYRYFDFNQMDTDFVIPDGWQNGIGRHPIDMYKNLDTGEVEYVMKLNGDNTQQYRLKKDGRGRDGRQKTITNRSRDVRNWDSDDDYKRITTDEQMECLTGYRNCDDYFKVTDKHVGTGSKVQSNYDKKYFDEPNAEFQAAIGISRNRQRLSGVPRRNVVNSARANPEARALCLTATMLRVKCKGDSKNQDVDNVIGVDQDKQREREEDCLPRKLSALIEFARKEHRDRVMKTMRNIAAENRRREAAERAVQLQQEEPEPQAQLDLEVQEIDEEEVVNSSENTESNDSNLLSRLVNVVSSVVSSGGDASTDEEEEEEEESEEDEVQEFSEWQQKEQVFAQWEDVITSAKERFPELDEWL